MSMNTEEAERLLGLAYKWRCTHCIDSDFKKIEQELIGEIDRLIEKRDELIRLREENNQAKDYATRLTRSIWATHYSENPEWEPLPDLMGVLSQIDNAVTGLVQKFAALTEKEKK